MMEIRRLTPQDAEALWHLRLESLKDSPAAFGEHHEDHARMSVEMVASRLDQKESFVYGAFADSALVGMAGFYRNGQAKRRHTGNVWGVYVQPAYRGQGISRRLMLSLLGEAKALSGLEQILLSVTQPEAKELYMSLGFWPYGKLQRAMVVDGESVDEEFLVLTL